MDLVNLGLDAFSHILKGQVPPPDLVKAFISKGLGYGIVGAAGVVKLPQILALAKSRSAAGLAPISAELEQVAYAIAAVYGWYTRLPFSAYGESLLLLAQNTALLGLIYKFNKTPGRAAVAVMAAATAAAGLMTPGTLTPARASRGVEAVSLLMLAARLPQIAKNAAAKSTGQLSLATYGANLAGATARVFTSITEGGGPALVRSYALSALLNGTLVAQILAYGKGKKQGARGRRAKATPTRRGHGGGRPKAA